MNSPSIHLLRALRATEFVHSTRRTSKLPSRRRLLQLPISSASNHLAPVRRAQFFTTTSAHNASRPKSSDRGPQSSETTQTDFGSMNVLGNTPPPTTAIDACLSDGFHFDNGLKIAGGFGCLLIAGEVFSWRPWEARSRPSGSRKGRMINERGQWDVEKEAWGVLDLVWPKPDMLILGLGPSTHPISPETRKYINSLGVRIDVQDTRNAAAQFNLLATERGVGSIAAALVPIGWKEPK